jgi:hypothetical protein
VQTAEEGGVSAPADTLDSLVQQASVPNLASLFRKAKQAGVINPVSVYGEGFAKAQQQQPQP